MSKGIIELAIDFQEIGKTNKMRVPQSMPVWEILMDIWKKLGDFQRDHGLFMPEDKEKRRKGQWLKPEKNLKHYNIQDGDLIQYKKKHGKMKYFLLDETSKTVRIDLSNTVEKIVERIAKGIGIHRKNTYEFGLRSLSDREHWLVKTQTLFEQGINIDQIPDLLFSRQFYGAQIDEKDDWQLHLFYLDSLDRIKHEDFPLTRKEAVMFSALSLQVSYNDYDEAKHTSQWLKLEPLLPELWHSEKGLKEDILSEWKRCSGQTQKSAKHRYYQLITTLKHYGFSFFMAFNVVPPEEKLKKGKRQSVKDRRSIVRKETNNSKGNLSPRAAGLGGKKELKPSVAKEMQKEILELEKGVGADWDYFPIFFGVSLEHYCVLDEHGNQMAKWSTTELKSRELLRTTITCIFPNSNPPEFKMRSIFATRISNTIDGYLHVKYRLHKDEVEEYTDSEDDNLADVMEIQYDPQTGAAFFLARPQEGWALRPDGSIMQHESNQIKVIDLNSAQRASMFLSDELGGASGFRWGNPQNIKYQDVNNAMHQAKNAFGTKFEEVLGSVKFNPKQLTRTQIDPLCSELYNSAQQISTRVQSLAALEGKGKTTGIYAAKAIADAMSTMFNFIEKVLENPEYPNIEFCVEQCEKAIKRALSLLEQDAMLIPLADNGTTLLVIKCIDEIDNYMNDVVESTSRTLKDIDGPGRYQVESDLNKLALAREWIIPSLKALAPALMDPRIKMEVSTIKDEINNVLAAIVGSTKKYCPQNSKLLPLITDSSKGLTLALNHLMMAINTVEPQLSEISMDFATPSTVMEEAVKNIKRYLSGVDDVVQFPVVDSEGVPVVEAEKLFVFFDAEITDGKGKPTSDVGQSLERLKKMVADTATPARAIQPDELSKQIRMSEKAAISMSEVITPLSNYINRPELRESVYELQNHISKMQQFASSNQPKKPEDFNEDIAQVETCLESLTIAAAEEAALIDLRLNSKFVAANTIALVDQALHSISSLTDPKSRSDLQQQTDIASKGLQDFLNMLQTASCNPNDRIKQMELLAEARKQTPKIITLVNSAKTGGRFVPDLNKKQDLLNAATKLKDSVLVLMNAIKAVDKVTGESSIETALVDFDSVKADLDSAEFLAKNGLFRPIPGQTRENATELLTRATKTLIRGVNGLTLASKTGTKLPEHITNCASGISQIAAAVRSVSSTIDDQDTQMKVVSAGKAVNEETLQVIDSCRQLAIDNENTNKKAALGKALVKWKTALTGLLETPKDLAEKDIKEASSDIAEGLKILNDAKYQPNSDHDMQEAAQGLLSVSKVVASGVSQLCSLVLTNPATLGNGAKIVGEASKQLAVSCANVIFGVEDEDARKAFLAASLQLLQNMNNLLEKSRTATTAKTRQALGEFKDEEAKAKEAIATLLQSLGTVMSKETYESINEIKSLMSDLLNESNQNITKLARPEILQKFTQGSQTIARVGGNLEALSNTDGSQKILAINAKEAVGGIKTLVGAVLAAKKAAEDGKDEILKLNLVKDLNKKTLAVAENTITQLKAATATTLENNEFTTEEISKNTILLNDSIQELLETAGVLNPATRQCESALKVIQKNSASLDAALQTITSGGKLPLVPNSPKILSDAKKSAVVAHKAFIENVQSLVERFQTGDSDRMASYALTIELGSPDLVTMVLGTAALSDESEFQKDLLETAMALSGSLGKLFNTLKVGNVHDKKSVEKVLAEKQATLDATAQLLNELQEGDQLQSELNEVIANIDHHISLFSIEAKPTTKRYQNIRADIQSTMKDLMEVTRKMVVMDISNVGEVGFTATRIGELSGKVVQLSVEAISVAEPSAKGAIKASVVKMIEELKQMVALTVDSSKGQDKSVELNNTFKNANIAFNQVLSSIKAADVGESYINEATKKLNATIQNINTTTLFAQAGQFEIDESTVSKMTVKQLQDQLKATLKETEALTLKFIEISKSGNDKDFGTTAIALAEKMDTISVQVSQNASKFADGGSKQKILNASKATAVQLIKLLSTSYEAHGNPANVALQTSLQTEYTTLTANLNEVLEVLGSAGAELVRAEKELSSTIKKIEALVKRPDEVGTTTGQEIIKAAREVMGSTSELTFSLTQEEIIAASKKAFAATRDLLARTKAASTLTKDTTLTINLHNTAKNTANSMIKLLEASKLSKTEENQKKVEIASDAVGEVLEKLVVNLRAIPGCEGLSLEEDNMEFETKAENELKKCAKIIEEAANALLQIQPRRKIKGEFTKDDINDAILSSAGGIASATRDLILAAEVAQSERKADAKSKGTKWHVDPAWANGLISAAQRVASSVKTLVEASNASVEGKAQQELLMATSHQVAQATAHLVAASKTKSDPNSKAIIRLGKAAKDVASSTGSLVEAAAKAARWEEEEAEKEESKVDFETATGKVKEMELQMKILKLEADLEKERRVLARMRQDRYRKTQLKK